MKRAGLLSYATVVALIALGSIAVAAPSFRAALHAPPTAAETGATGSTGDGTGPTGASGPIETPAPLAPEEEGDGDGGAAPDFTACGGMTGLDNAICRHEALLLVHPENKGLQHSLTRLEANLERHEAKQGWKTEQGSGEHPGNGNGHGHGHANGHDKDDAGEG